MEDEDAFVRAVLGSFGSYPPYFLRLRERNRLGPRVFGAITFLDRLDAGHVARLRGRGAVVVDVRPVGDYAAGHIPASLANTLRPQLASWLGWLVEDRSVPLVFVTDDHTDRRELLRQCLNIGYEHLAGEIGIDAWRAGGGDVTTTTMVSAEEMDARRVVDVRQPNEFASGHVPGASNVSVSVRSIGALAALYPAVWGLGQLVTGTLSDRVGRKWLIAGGMWVQAGAIAEVAETSGFAPWAGAVALLGAGTAWSIRRCSPPSATSPTRVGGPRRSASTGCGGTADSPWAPSSPARWPTPSTCERPSGSSPRSRPPPGWSSPCACTRHAGRRVPRARRSRRRRVAHEIRMPCCAAARSAMSANSRSPLALSRWSWRSSAGRRVGGATERRSSSAPRSRLATRSDLPA